MATQEQRDAGFIYQDTRANFKDIIAKRSDLVQFDSGRLGTPGSTTLYYAGLVLGIVTASGLFTAYNSSNSDGSQVAVAVLADDTIADSTGYGTEIRVIRVGTLFQSLLIGLDSG